MHFNEVSQTLTHVTTTSLNNGTFLSLEIFLMFTVHQSFPKGEKKKQYSDINCDSLILPTLRNFTKTESYSIHPFVLGFLAKQNVFLSFNHIVCISAFKIFSCHVLLHCLNIGPYILNFLRGCLPSSYRPISFHSNSFTPL